MNNYLYEELKRHIGHNIVCVEYGDGENIAIECEDCYVTLYDVEKVQKISEKDVPMDFNHSTKEVTVHLPQYAGVLFTLETNKRKEKTAFNYVWEIYGDSIEEALKDYGYELQLA